MKIAFYYAFVLAIAITAFIFIVNFFGPSTETPSHAGGENNHSSPRDEVHEKAPPENDITPDHEEGQTTVEQTRFAAIGDVIIYSSMLHDAKTADGSYDFHHMLTDVTPYFAKADLLMANQESMIGGPELGLSDYPMFNSPFEIADALNSAGVDVVNIANNHTLDRNKRAHEAIMNATDYWNELGIPYTGAYRSEEDANELRVVDKDGISFAFLGYTYGTNGIPLPPDKPWIVNLLDEEKIVADIREAKEVADVVVINYHFGNEYERMPNDSQKKWAQLAADEGAHIVIGHHSHVLQPFAWLDRADGGKTFVAYSLGNFLAAQDGVYKDLGGLIYVTVEKRTEDGQTDIKLLEPEFLPTWQHKPGWRDYRVIPLHEVTEQQLPGANDYLQEIKEHVSQWMPELTFTHD